MSNKIFLEQLKSRINLVQVVERYLPLKKKGQNHWGLCPFHKEKTPSFSVKGDEGYYHCFGCGVHGDVISFLQEKEGREFMDVVRQLAHEAGLELPNQVKLNPEEIEKRSSLYDILQEASSWFEKQLNTTAAAHGRSWLDQRELLGITIQQFQLGYAPKDAQALITHLKGEGYDIKQMADAGLIIIPEDKSAPYSRYRNRIIFPINDSKGRIIAFGGRTLDDAPAKYINSPSSLLFDKKRTLYGLHHAITPIRQSKRVIVTEGYTDAIALHQAGLSDSVATLGTSMSSDHLLSLWRWVNCPILCFDGDKAGESASQRAILTALPFVTTKKSIACVILPATEDPDSIIRNQGADFFQKLCENAQPLIQVLQEMLLPPSAFKTPEGQANALTAIDKTISVIKDKELRLAYRRHLRDGFYSRIHDKKSSKTYKTSFSSVISHLPLRNASSQLQKIERNLLLLFLDHPHLIDEWGEHCLSLPDQNPALRKLKEYLLSAPPHERESRNQLNLYLQGCHLTDEIILLQKQASYSKARTPEDLLKHLLLPLERDSVKKQKESIDKDNYQLFRHLHEQELSLIQEERDLLDPDFAKKNH